jgi:hypothetical protein
MARVGRVAFGPPPTLEEARRRAEHGWGPEPQEAVDVPGGTLSRALVLYRRHSGAQWSQAGRTATDKALAIARDTLDTLRSQGYRGAEVRIEWTFVQEVRGRDDG